MLVRHGDIHAKLAEQLSFQFVGSWIGSANSRMCRCFSSTAPEIDIDILQAKELSYVPLPDDQLELINLTRCLMCKLQSC